MAKALSKEKQEKADHKLINAAWSNNVTGIKQALDDGAQVDVRAKEGSFASLHFTASNNNPESVRVLLEAGAEVDAHNSVENTPLHLAALNNDMFAAKLLLIAGARLDLKNDKGKTPVDYAGELNSSDLFKYLRGVAKGEIPRPTVGLDMDKRNEVLAALASGRKPTLGEQTKAVEDNRAEQRRRALELGEGI